MKLGSLPGAKRGTLPKRPPEPQLATAATEPPTGDRWIHEIKFDGYRMTCRIEDGTARFWSRNRRDWTERLPELADDAAGLPVRRTALLDGEIVVFGASGATEFQALQSSFQPGLSRRIVFMAFDLLHLDGYDLREVVLENRQSVLRELVPADGSIRATDGIEGNGPEVFHHARRLGLEGIVSKRRDRPYRTGRGHDWLKMKCVSTAEFVIGGYTPPKRRTGLFSALVLGRFVDGHLHYCGKVGTGFSDDTLHAMKQLLDADLVDVSPFVGDFEIDRGTKWVRPIHVAQIEYLKWPVGGHLRNPSFRGLREDVDPRIVRGLPSHVDSEAVVDAAAETAASTVPESEPASDRLPAVVRNGSGPKLTNPSRVLYPDIGVTKFRLAQFYAEIAAWMLPHVAERPLALVRAPSGYGGKTFFQKHPRRGMPDAVQRLDIPAEEGRALYVDDLAGLLGLVQVSSLEIHVRNARIDRLDRPDRIVFDLDPDETLPWTRVVRAATDLRGLLEEAGLRSFVKTTGGKGLHVFVPLGRRHDWDTADAFSEAVAARLAATDPARYTLSSSKRLRTGRIFIDVMRNRPAAVTAAAYTTRAKPTASVSTPVEWDELPTLTGADHFNVTNLVRRLVGLTRDPWEGIADCRQTISAGARRTVGAT